MASAAILLAGPTGSGKSGLALDIAEEFDGEIINADSMQVYRDLRVLTARPGPEDEARVRHHLYGVLDADQRCSAGRWLDLAAEALDLVRRAGRIPVFVGGTGLYLRALTEGLAPTPEIPEHVKREAKSLSAQLAPEEFHRRLAERDPEMAARLRPSDLQRVSRAWQVIEATGVSLAEWQAREPSAPLIAEAGAVRLVLDLPREIVRARCDARFDAMIEGGALDEVRALRARGLRPGLPVLKALGVPQLSAYLEGAHLYDDAIKDANALDDAIEAAKVATRQYVKRQSTWFRNQMPEWIQVDTQDSESFSEKNIPIIRNLLLTR